MSAFADIGYREDGPEDINAVAGSVSTPMHAAHVARSVPSVAHIRATPTGERSLSVIRSILEKMVQKPHAATRATRAAAVQTARENFWSTSK